jgi:membrane-bound lytic murein transglycosylase D
MVDEVLDEYKLPRALAYLPVIESAYVPTVTSSAGAYGLWQFMAPTAKEYGLDIDWWIDERAHPEMATRAAAYFLRDLYGMFGDWPLALAAYNAGPGRVRRALEETGASTFWELYDQAAIPRETRGYVPTFFATVLIASDPAAYGFELRENQDSDVRRVIVQGPVSLDYVAEVCGTSADELRKLNPQLRRGVLPPRSTALRVPSAAVEPIAARAASLRYEDPYMKIATFTLRPGDSLKKLSRALGVSSEEIARMNNLRKPTVGVGQTIFLPVGQTELSAKLDAARHQSAARYHTVKKGETLFSIARRHGLSVEELTDLNRLGNHTIQPGERLRVSLGGTLTGGM